MTSFKPFRINKNNFLQVKYWLLLQVSVKFIIFRVFQLFDKDIFIELNIFFQVKNIRGIQILALFYSTVTNFFTR